MNACKHIYYMHIQGSSMNSILFDEWAKCGGKWKTSSFYLSIVERHRKRHRGKRVWLMADEMDKLLLARIMLDQFVCKL